MLGPGGGEGVSRHCEDTSDNKRSVVSSQRAQTKLSVPQPLLPVLSRRCWAEVVLREQNNDGDCSSTTLTPPRPSRSFSNPKHRQRGLTPTVFSDFPPPVQYLGGGMNPFIRPQLEPLQKQESGVKMITIVQLIVQDNHVCCKELHRKRLAVGLFSLFSAHCSCVRQCSSDSVQSENQRKVQTGERFKKLPLSCSYFLLHEKQTRVVGKDISLHLKGFCFRVWAPKRSHVFSCSLLASVSVTILNLLLLLQIWEHKALKD